MSPCQATNCRSPVTISLLRSTYAKFAAFSRLQNDGGQNKLLVALRSKTRRRLCVPSGFVFFNTVKHFIEGPLCLETIRIMLAPRNIFAKPSLPFFVRNKGSSYARIFPTLPRDNGSRTMYCSQFSSSCAKRGESFWSGIGSSTEGTSIHPNTAGTTSPRERPRE